MQGSRKIYFSTNCNLQTNFLKCIDLSRDGVNITLVKSKKIYYNSVYIGDSLTVLIQESQMTLCI